MKKVLVTGATGFIGRYVIEELLKSNHSVIATSSGNNLSNVPWLPKVDFIPFDFKAYSPATNYYRFFKEPDCMIHLAWEGLPNYKSLFHFEDNLSRHYVFLKNMVTNGLKDLSVTGTCLEYGFKEGALREDMATEPANAYAIAKDTLRKFLQQLQQQHPFLLKWMRLFYMYGQGQGQKSLFAQLDAAIGNNEASFNMSGGEQVRDYLPVEDVARFVKMIALQQQVDGVINCSSGTGVRLKDLVAGYLHQKNATISLNLGFYPYLDYEPMAFWGDNSKLKTILTNEKSD